jgi:transposase, IS6 family
MRPSVKAAGAWRYVYRAVDQFGQIINVLVSDKRDLAAARRFSTRALNTTTLTPVEVITDKAAVYPRVPEELAPGAWHHTEPYATNRIEADHGQLKRRLRPMRGLKTDRGARIINAGHGFVQNIRRGHYALGAEEPANLQVLAAFTELALTI